MSLPPFASLLPAHETPWEALGRFVQDRVTLEGRVFRIARPEHSDRLLDHPTVRSAFAGDDFLPYWTELWPAARMLAKAVLREPWAAGLEAVEIGCGLGLPGIAALDRGLRLTFTDCDVSALRLAADNARRNGFADFRTLTLDWRYPPDDLRVPVVLASDLLYEVRHVDPVMALIKRILLPGGLCLMTDQDRMPGCVLRDALAAEGLAFTTRIIRAGEPGGRREKGTLYRITHALGNGSGFASRTALP